MDKNFNNKQGGVASFIGEPTPAKVSGLTYSLAAVGMITLSFLAMLLLFAFGVTAKEGYAESDLYLYVSYLVTPTAFAFVSWWVLRWKGTPLRVFIKEQKCLKRYFLLAVTLQIGLLSLSELNSLFLNFLGKFGYESQPLQLPSMDGFGFIGVLLAVAVMPALFEEVIFRGLLLKGMDTFGTVGAVLISGGLFALFHQNPAQTAYQFCCGAAFALVAIRSGSILPTVLAHFINNALILTLQKLGVSAFPQPVYISILCVSAVCLIGTLSWLIFVDKGTQPRNVSEGKKERKRIKL